MEKKDKRCPDDACEKIFRAFNVSPFGPIRRISNRHQEASPGKPSASPAKVLDLQKKPNRKQPAAGPEEIVIEVDYTSQPTPTNGKAKPAAKQHQPVVPVPKISPGKDVIQGNHGQLHVYQTAVEKSEPGAEKAQPGKRNGQVASKIEEKKQAAKLVNEQILEHDQAKGSHAVGQSQAGKEDTGKQTGKHLEDKFTDYIKRAKIRIRSMSNVGDPGKSSRAGDHGGKDHHFGDFIKRARMKIRTTSSIKDRSDS